jgi:hypothetical protein
VRFEFHITGNIKITVFWNVMPYNMVDICHVLEETAAALMHLDVSYHRRQ